MYVAISPFKPCIPMPTNNVVEYRPRPRPRPRLFMESPPRVRCFIEEECERPYNGALLYLERGGQYGAYGVTTLKRSYADMSQQMPSKNTEPSLDDSGGNSINNDSGGGDGSVGGGTGGGGSGPGGDNDDYIFDDKDENNDKSSGLFRARRLLAEVFDRGTLNAVLQEWMKTMRDLPVELQRACELRALSSVKLTRFLFFNTRPTFIRFLARLLSRELALDFVAKIVADSSLPHKLCLEAVFSLGSSVWLEKEDLKLKPESWPLVFANAATNATCNALFLWSLAPKIASFENNNSYPQRVATSFFRKAFVFFVFGFTAKTSVQVITHPNISIGKFSKEALAAGLSVGFVSNLRYHLTCGIDKRLQLYFDDPIVSLAFCLALRFVNVVIGTHSHNWVRSSDQVVSCLPLLHSLLSPPENGSSGANWFNSNKPIATGFGIVDTSTNTSLAAKRKRVRVPRKQKVR